METCKYGSGADKRKPTAVKRKGVVYRAYEQIPGKNRMRLRKLMWMFFPKQRKIVNGNGIKIFSCG